MATSSILSVKRSLRADIRAARALRRDRPDHTGLRNDEALGLRDHALAWLHTVPGRHTVTVFESWDVEPPTHLLIEALLQHGHEVLTPITLPNLDLSWRRILAPMDFRDETSPEHAWQYGEALGVDAIAQATAVLTPGLTVDTAGRRLGQGGGCYDRALVRRGADVPAVTVVFTEEYGRGDVPADDHDQRVNGVLTPDGLAWIAGELPPRTPQADPGP